MEASRLMLVNLSSTSWCFCGAAFPLTKSKKIKTTPDWTSVQTIWLHFFWKITDSELVAPLVSGSLPAQAFSRFWHTQSSKFNQVELWSENTLRKCVFYLTLNTTENKCVLTESGGPWRKYLWDRQIKMSQQRVENECLAVIHLHFNTV